MKFTDFEEYFSGKTACYEYIQALRWGIDGKDYKCSKCGYASWYRGRKQPEGYSKRCSRCKHDESLTAGTFFHRLRMHIVSAFYIIYGVHESKSFESKISEILYRLHDRSEKLAITEKAMRDFITRFRARVADWEVTKKIKGRVFVDTLSFDDHSIFVCNSWDGNCFFKYAEAFLNNSEDSLLRFLKKYVSEDALITLYDYEVKGKWINDFYQTQIVNEDFMNSEGFENHCRVNWTTKLKEEISNNIAAVLIENDIDGLNSFLLEYNYLHNNTLYDSLNNAIFKGHTS